MTAYNLSLINASDVVPMIQGVNDVLMFGWFGNMLLITIFIIMLMNYYYSTLDFKKSAGMSALITAAISIFLRSFMIINDTALLIAWVIAAFLIAWNYLAPD